MACAIVDELRVVTYTRAATNGRRFAWQQIKLLSIGATGNWGTIPKGNYIL